MIENLKNATVIQKLIFTIWLVLSAFLIPSWLITTSDRYAVQGSGDIYFYWFLGISLVTFILYKVWANKEK